MKEARYFFVPDAASRTDLPADEALHACRVLRLEAGDEVFLMDGEGHFFRAELTLVSQKKCLYWILEALPQEKAWRGCIHLAIAPTKNADRMEWLAEKATEIGFDKLSLLNCQFSERRQMREDRLEKIVVSAVKQSRKPFSPKVQPLQSFKDFLAELPSSESSETPLRFICHCYDEIPRQDFFSLLQEFPADSAPEILVLVGPEGDFSIDEVRLALGHGFQSVTLGNFRLRTETAGLLAVTMAQLALRK